MFATFYGPLFAFKCTGSDFSWKHEFMNSLDQEVTKNIQTIILNRMKVISELD